jgi:hypothetical protein
MNRRDLELKLRGISNDSLQMAGEMAGRTAACTLRADDAELICSMIHDLSQILIEVLERI